MYFSKMCVWFNFRFKLNGLIINKLSQSKKFNLVHNHQNTLGTGTIRNVWLRNSVSEGYDGKGKTPKYYGCKLISSNVTQTQTKTYAYQVTNDINGNPLPNSTWLINPNDVSCPYTLRVAGFTSNTTRILDNSSAALGDVFPNPAFTQLSIPISLDDRQDIELSIYNIEGKQIRQIFNGEKNNGKHLLSINVEDLVQGIYLIQLRTQTSVYYKKFTKLN